MSLIEQFKTDCVRLVQKTAEDGAGGHRTTWEESEHFCASIIEKSHTEPENAERKRAKAFYDVFLQRMEDIRYHDVFRRVSDGKIFRVTSNPDDKKTPLSAHMSFAIVTAEEWRLPDDKNRSNTKIS